MKNGITLVQPKVHFHYSNQQLLYAKDWKIFLRGLIENIKEKEDSFVSIDISGTKYYLTFSCLIRFSKIADLWNKWHIVLPFII